VPEESATGSKSRRSRWIFPSIKPPRAGSRDSSLDSGLTNLSSSTPSPISCSTGGRQRRIPRVSLDYQASAAWVMEYLPRGTVTKHQSLSDRKGAHAGTRGRSARASAQVPASKCPRARCVAAISGAPQLESQSRPQSRGARFWTNWKPKRPLTQRWPSVTDESFGEVTLTMSLSWTWRLTVQPTPQ
jgi:hypothetical protein